MTQIVTIERRRQVQVFRWLLPAWFLVGAGLAALWPGHGWQLFSIGALPGVWLSFLLDAGVDDAGWVWLLPALLGGAPLLWFLGGMLDRIGTDVRLWSLAALVSAAGAGFLLLTAHADLDAAFAAHGGLLPFVICALQLGGYGATLLLLVVGAGGREWVGGRGG
ncbi:MAG TPA: hypothetical protein ENI87_00050 [bacterium]|nr:hypothetical protein [bacterium]